MARVDPDRHLETDVGVVVAAGGCSERFGSAENKLLVPLNGLPLVCHCIQTFLRIVPTEMVVLVVPETLSQRFEACLRDAGLNPGLRVIPGGTTRQNSVVNGLAALPSRATYAAVHDAARPYTDEDLIRRCIDSARTRGSGVAARRITDTVKVAGPDLRVCETRDRSLLWAAETPQVFERTVIAQAYARVAELGVRVTDESQAVETFGEPVYLVEHNGDNTKVTYATDLPAYPGGGPAPAY
ncbi:MAG: 2-C-methyl-D-erythritol 4-phosphate cytidylyltransferase [Lentisphaerae bacterium]|jgi:2-C-methyl-D-erythritol 4-phosphate cytidylyltransferase|nr:2-C-methyl-D-erythritol 4-phosphate cytidylyltransferase [Lentisphaerota bacterium]MBT4821157.1 2-C-methyl-D-erythritol 4-phosphate cytidylyltransferase [Lentisphaerota bacterium]MBT5611344.1 2-C-methyl-D-erythritol 4-phosphate cytidylyltransferase [Lentisphaerota bacterium]MBT7058130.1 2-C-methyl-D-erythritol 4-phosphate cytidylyltransferase [Lentisphaerota bacterium]MBT7848090.1 2-C-methyl-D-erythritol 4-phosphate cytidylyltransferase [Lentisphaerota bacterium]